MPATVERRSRPLLLGHRALRRIDLVTVGRLGIVAGAALAAVLAVAVYGRPYDFFDLKIYHGAMVWWADGGDLYRYVYPQTTLGFTYPPFAALVMVPMAAFSAITAGWITTVASVAVLTLIMVAIVGPIADRCGWPRWFVVALAVCLAVATEPVRETLGYGQVNLLLAGLVIFDLVALRRRAAASAATPQRVRQPAGAASLAADEPDDATERAGSTQVVTLGDVVSGAVGTIREFPPVVWLQRGWAIGAFAGVGIGLATAIKLIPGLFIIYFVVSRQWRVALTTTATAIGATIVAFVLAGRDSATYFGEVMWQTGRIGEVDATPNQSLAGLLARLYDSPVTPGLMWLAFAGLLLAVGLSRAAGAHAEGDELTAFTLVSLTANAISPISWTHHLVFVVPAIVILFDGALRRRHAARSLRVGRFPTLGGLKHGLAAAALLALFVVSPMWRYEHRLPDNVSHYADGLVGAFWENSLALAIIVLIAALPWRPGADPAFYPER
jgi:hypothetical protein